MWKKLSDWVQWLEVHWSFWGRLLRWVSTVAVGILSGWAAWANELLKAYAPYSYVIGGLLGAALFAFVLALFGWFASAIARARYMNRLAYPAEPVNPLDETFTKKRVSMAHIADPVTRKISRKTFIDCELIGLGRAYGYSACTFQDIKGTFACDMVALQTPANVPRHPPSNAFFVENCTIVRCGFYNQTLIFDLDTSRDLFKVTEARAWLVPPLPEAKPQ